MGFGSILGKIGKGALSIGTGGVSGALSDIFGAGGAALGAMGQSGAQNRDAQFSGQMDLASLLSGRDVEMQRLRAQADNDFTNNQINRSQEGRASGQDAWRKLLGAQHLMNPGAAPQLAGKYNVAPRQATDMERTGADALSQEVMTRLQGGNPIGAVERRTPEFAYDPMSTIDPRLLKAGKGEKVMGALAPFLSFLGRPKEREA